jgi:adenylate cyclase, class 2
MENQEIEVKFYLSNLSAFAERVEKAGSHLESARVHETNLRFDFPDRSLSAGKRVLRLRQDEQSIVTYKGPARPEQGVTVREEIEFTVSDFTRTRQLLEALGYQVIVMYEKYRTTWGLEGVHITLDEMPYGNFSEIEGPSVEAVRAVADRLHLHWDARINASYLELFSQFKTSRKMEMENLSFAEFEGLTCIPQDLGVIPGDQGA